MSNKPNHYGITNDKDVSEINWALRTFVERVRDGDEIHEHLLQFVADGVERYLKGGTPWSKNRDKSLESGNKIALMKLILENGGTQQQMAAHLGKTEGRVSQMLKPIRPDFDGQYQMAQMMYKASWEYEFKNKGLADMLNKLSEFR